MEERTYFSVAAEWWADAARKVNRKYDMKLSRDTLMCFEKKLATEIKEFLEFYIRETKKYEAYWLKAMQELNMPYSANADEFYCISLTCISPIIRDALREFAIQCIFPALPSDVMIVSSNLVFIREACNYEYMRCDHPLACVSDKVIFKS